jgi:uncharacterized protein YjbI with pentapeptide repeats
MSSFVLLLFVASMFFLMGVFFWGWWSIPRERVPPHLSRPEQDQLLTENQLRQTSYQVLTGGLLVFTFSLTVFQSTINYQQWKQDYELKDHQETVDHLTEALKAAASVENETARIGGIFALANLGIRRPDEYSTLVNGTLASAVRGKTAARPITALSKECARLGSKEGTVDRREAAPEDLQTAMSALGDVKIAKTRHKFFNYSPGSKTCEYNSAVDEKSKELSSARLRLSHLFLDNLYLSGHDFSCATFTQSSLHRVSFAWAVLVGADFSGAEMGDATVVGFEDHGKVESLEWKRHRCWITDFSSATLVGAKFTDAGLEGAVLTEADLTNATLVRTRLMRAELTKATLNGAYLNGAYLVNAILNRAKLNGATLEGADLSSASLVNADISGADLKDAQVSEQQLRTACVSQQQPKNLRVVLTIKRCPNRSDADSASTE